VNRLVVILLGVSAALAQATEKGTANFYQSAPHEYLGKEIRLRVASLSPVPELTAADQGFVWMEAVTGRPNQEEGKILLRVPENDSAKLAKAMNLPSSSGRWLKGTFSGHESGAVLPSAITQKAPYYIQVVSEAAASDTGAGLAEVETASGSLMVTPKTKESKKTETPSPVKTAATPVSVPAKKESEGPKAVLLRTKAGEPLQLRTAQSVKMQADFCEIIDQDGKLSLVGRALVVGVLPLPRDGTVPSKDEAASALRLYAEQSQKTPEAINLLSGAKASWEKLAGASVAKTASPALPELEDVETAAGFEEPESGYPLWFGWATGAGISLLIFLGWAWSRPRSTSA
jgi:hypothetical protein